MSTRRLSLPRSVIFAALLLRLAFTALPAGATSSLMVRGVDAGDYPRVTLSVSVPAEVVGESSEPPDYTVIENGERAEVLSVSPAESDATQEIVLLVDSSGSMKGRPLTDAKLAAMRFISALPEPAKVAIVGFGSKPYVSSGFTSDRSTLASAISNLRTSGETAVYDALRMAARMKPSEPGQKINRTIVLISDGGDSTSITTLNEAVRSVTSQSMPVLVVAVQSPDFNPRPLETVARKSGGRLSSVGATADLSEYLESLAHEIGQSWIVEFRSNRPATKDLEIDVTANTREGRASAGLTIPNPMYVLRLPYDESVLAVQDANPLILITSIFLLFAAVVLGLLAAFTAAGRRASALEGMRYYDQNDAGAVGGPDDNMSAVSARIVGAVEVVAGRRGYVGALAPLLSRADVQMRPSEYITLHVLFVVLSGFILQLLTHNLAVAALGVVGAALGPLMYLRHKADKRREGFDEQLPDVLNLMAGGLRTGWGLQQAIDLVVSEGSKPASDEFRRAQIETRLGVPLDRALRSIAERIESEQFDWVCTAVAIQREVGGNLAEVLDNVARSIRDRASLKRQVAALSAEGRISAWILIALPFVVIGGLLVINPQYIVTATRTPMGIAMGALMVVLLTAGFVWIRIVSRIEY